MLTSVQIREKIRYYEELISQYTDEKSKKEDDHIELEHLKIKVANLQTRFGERQSQRKSSLAVLAAMPQRNRIYPTYCNGMSELLSGREFNKSYDGLTTAGQNVKKEIENVSDMIDDYERKISSANSQREYWKSQLRAALAREAEEETD